MSSIRGFKQKLSVVSRLWEQKHYDAALAEVEGLLKTWPGNAYLLLLWASLVQLQEKPTHSLDETKQALQQTVELDRTSPAGAIELGHFLDAVEDDPQGAAKAYSEGVAAARQRLIEGLIGQGKALLQLDKKKGAFHCLVEAQRLMHFQPTSKRSKSESPAVDSSLRSPTTDQVEELLKEVSSSRSA